MEKINTAVIGGGAVGLAVARELLLRGVQDLFVFEKSRYFADGQSGRNSGVIHAGIYYPKDSLKARLCVEGNPLLYDFCARHDVAFDKTGKLIVATSPDEEKRIQDLLQRALRNNVEDIRLIDGKAAKNHEPNVKVLSALHAPSTGVIDAAGYVKALSNEVRRLGGTIVMPAKVVGIIPKSDHFIIEIERPDGTRESIGAENLVNSAGLYSDVIARMINPEWDRELVPLRGEYFKFNRARRKEIGMKGLNIYPAPGLVHAGGRDVLVVGIHLTPTFGLGLGGRTVVGNTVIVGPEFGPVANREDYESGRLGPDIFMEKVSRFFPNLEPGDLEMDFTGIMANLGKGDDWIIERDKAHPNCIQMVGIDSPALTSSLAIAKYTSGL